MNKVIISPKEKAKKFHRVLFFIAGSMLIVSLIFKIKDIGIYFSYELLLYSCAAILFYLISFGIIKKGKACYVMSDKNTLWFRLHPETKLKKNPIEHIKNIVFEENKITIIFKNEGKREMPIGNLNEEIREEIFRLVKNFWLKK